MANDVAPPGTVFVCGACGKTSRSRYGWNPDNGAERVADPGWDSSCMLHAVLCYAEKREGSWRAVPPEAL